LEKRRNQRKEYEEQMSQHAESLLPRPRPGISKDTQFFWDGCRAQELRIQECTGCGRLSHPPVVRCPKCGSYELAYKVAAGRGTLYSFAEPVHPPMPFMEYPYAVGLVELEEGTRLLTNIVDIAPEKLEIGMPLELVFRETDPEMILPMFRPVLSAPGEEAACGTIEPPVGG